MGMPATKIFIQLAPTITHARHAPMASERRCQFPRPAFACERGCVCVMDCGVCVSISMYFWLSCFDCGNFEGLPLKDHLALQIFTIMNVWKPPLRLFLPVSCTIQVKNTTMKISSNSIYCKKRNVYYTDRHAVTIRAFSRRS